MTDILDELSLEEKKKIVSLEMAFKVIPAGIREIDAMLDCARKIEDYINGIDN